MRFSKSILVRWAAAVSLAFALVIGASACSSDPEDNVDQVEENVDDKEKEIRENTP